MDPQDLEKQWPVLSHIAVSVTPQGILCGDVSSPGGNPENSVGLHGGGDGKGPCKQARQPESPGMGRVESLVLGGIWVLRTPFLG